MRWVVAGSVVVAILVGAVLVVAPPGRVLSRPSLAECERMDTGREPAKASVGWVWSSSGWGWGCRFSYADGSSGTATWQGRLGTSFVTLPADLGPPRPSRVDGLPVPGRAEPLPPIVDCQDSCVEEIWLVRGASEAAVIDWYEEHVPRGVWRDWVPCFDHAAASGPTLVWQWTKPGDLSLLLMASEADGGTRVRMRWAQGDHLGCN